MNSASGFRASIPGLLTGMLLFCLGLYLSFGDDANRLGGIKTNAEVIHLRPNICTSGSRNSKTEYMCYYPTLRFSVAGGGVRTVKINRYWREGLIKTGQFMPIIYTVDEAGKRYTVYVDDEFNNGIAFILCFAGFLFLYYEYKHLIKNKKAGHTAPVNKVNA